MTKLTPHKQGTVELGEDSDNHYMNTATSTR
ncbi:hypothetical protein ACVWYF_004121 [Hymenobacter sp. UYAg731]